MVSRSRGRSGKCTCKPGWMILAWILAAVGIFALVAGFASQFGASDPTAINLTVLGWYFGGIVLIGLAKMSKWKGCSCGIHGMK